jgi:hypothetical protein
VEELLFGGVASMNELKEQDESRRNGQYRRIYAS